MSHDFNELTEQMRREIRERADIFMHDAAALAEKYLGEGGAAAHPGSVSTIAAMLANQYAAEVVAMSMRQVAAEAASMSRDLKLSSATTRKTA
jgi:hypothetical protein